MIIDYDLNFLTEAAHFFDFQLARIHKESESSNDPDSFGYYDRVEYVTGLGFVTCQQYITAIRARRKAPKSSALRAGPHHRSNLPMVTIVNAAANYWKHSSEWDGLPDGSIAKQTVTTLEQLGVDLQQPYVLTNVLAALLTPLPQRFQHLLPFLKRWRDALFQENDKYSKK